MLSEFSPIPGTPDGEPCRRWIDLDEPLYHNKTAFTLVSLGDTELNRLINLAGKLNQQVRTSKGKNHMFLVSKNRPGAHGEAIQR